MRKSTAVAVAAALAAGGAVIYLTYRKLSKPAPQTPPRKEAEEHEKYQKIYDNPEDDLENVTGSILVYPNAAENLEPAQETTSSKQNLYSHLLEPSPSDESTVSQPAAPTQESASSSTLYPTFDDETEEAVVPTPIPSAPVAAPPTWSCYGYSREEDDETTMIEIYVDCLPKLPAVVGYLNTLFSFLSQSRTPAKEEEESSSSENEAASTTTTSSVEAHHRDYYRDIVIITEATSLIERSSESLVKPILVPKGAFKIIGFMPFPSTRSPSGVLQINVPEVLSTGTSSTPMTREVVHYLTDFIQLYFKNPFDEIEKPLPGKLTDLVPIEYHRFFEDLTTGELTERILVAQNLQIRPLLDLTCAAVASMIRGKSPEQIREMFGIENDFSPEEEEKIREENKWCEQE